MTIYHGKYIGNNLFSAKAIAAGKYISEKAQQFAAVVSEVAEAAWAYCGQVCDKVMAYVQVRMVIIERVLAVVANRTMEVTNMVMAIAITR